MNILLKNETIKKHTHTNILYLPKMNNGKTNKAITIQIFTYIYITMYNENEKVSLTKLKTIQKRYDVNESQQHKPLFDIFNAYFRGIFFRKDIAACECYWYY